MPDSTPNKFAEAQKQPLFTAIAKSDVDFKEAYAAASWASPGLMDTLGAVR